MTILISHFLRSGELEIFTDYRFVIRINKITYSKQKMGRLIKISTFTAFFQQHDFPIHLYRVAYKWRMTYQQVTD